MIHYTITTHGHLPGARLSKAGHWCNHPHPSVEAAAEAAEQDAGKEEFRITRKAHAALPAYQANAARPLTAPEGTQ